MSESGEIAMRYTQGLTWVRGHPLPGCWIKVNRVETLRSALTGDLLQLMPGKRAFR